MGENFDISNFDLNNHDDSNKTENNGQLNMSVSAICNNKDGQKYAYVTFSDGIREAEGIIPKCEIIRNEGYADIEVKQLEKYMQDNLAQLKKMAAGVDIFSSFLTPHDGKRR